MRSQFKEGREGWKGNNSEFKKWRAGTGRKAMKNGRMEGREDGWNAGWNEKSKMDRRHWRAGLKETSRILQEGTKDY